MKKPQKNMYQDAFVWNVCKGCLFDCVYCRPSFQRQSKRHKQICKHKNKDGEAMCYTYEPHFHYERLWKTLPLTKGDQFIWCCSSGDITFYPELWINIILARVRKLKNRTFFFQSKDPKCFAKYDFPENIILGITLETNRVDGYDKISKSTNPLKRSDDFFLIEHPRKFITIEPILDFDLSYFVGMIKDLEPERVYIGYDTKNCKLPEPSIEKTEQLIKELEKFTRVKRKYIKEDQITENRKQQKLETFY